MNFSIHLPEPLLTELDSYARTHHTSRSHVVREAVAAYLLRQAKSEWPADMVAWMKVPAVAADTIDWPDFDALRKEVNDGWDARSNDLLKDLDDLA